MAVATGAGALNPTKPVTVNDMMEAIALPGIKGGTYLDFVLGGDVPDTAAVTGVRTVHAGTLGGAGYTEVLDDIIVEVTSVLNAADAVITFGWWADDDDTQSADTAVGGNAQLATFTIPAAVGVYSVTRGNISFTAAAAETEAMRTFGPASTITGQKTPGIVSFHVTDNSVVSGKARVYVRTHYTAVNFGPGL